jgi:hypothetical protein
LTVVRIRRLPTPRLVADLRPFQLDHLGTQVAKSHRGERPASAREVGGDEPVQRATVVWRFTMSITLIEDHQRRDDWREGVAWP